MDGAVSYLVGAIVQVEEAVVKLDEEAAYLVGAAVILEGAVS